VELLHPRANRPYRVMGGDYRPMTQRAPFRQRGTASWYGRKFHGQPTSIGERYDMYGMTAAHPTFPIPSFARVTHLGNGRSVVVRVNDRGPFLHGRTIDLSYLAAHKLGYIEQGQAEVEVELLDPARPMADTAGAAAGAAAAEDLRLAFVPKTTFEASLATAPQEAGRPVQPVVQPVEQPVVQVVVQPAVEVAPQITTRDGLPPAAAGAPSQVSPSPAHYLQLGAFSVRTNAEAASTHLRRQLEWLQVPIEIEPYGSLYRVQAGPFAVREVAARAVVEVRARTGLRPLLLPREVD
jgi:rare lipoprotein A